MDFAQLLYDSSAWIIPLVLAITMHEAAHGFVAYKLGDDTAYRLGRVTFNPFKHVDTFGTIILPGMLFLMRSPFLFGYAKPVPVNFSALRRPRRDSFLVAIAGPGTNILLAYISALLLHLEVLVSPEDAPWLYMNLYRSVLINLVLAIFNMLPILPLDGGRVLSSLLPPSISRTYARTERYGMLVIFGLLLVSAVAGLGILDYLVGKPTYFLYEYILKAAGHGLSGA